MRELPILLADGSVDEHAVVAIQSCMLFPNDPESIEEDRRAFRLYVENNIPNKRLLKRQDDEWKGALPGGLFAGSMLMLMVQFDIYYPELKVGMNKSAFASAVVAKKAGRKLSKDTSTVRKYWAEYKNSAHLWAGLMAVMGWFGEAEVDGLRKLPVDFLHVVDVADQLADAAQNLIEDWHPWRLPKDAPIQRVPFALPRPDDEDVKLMRSYSAG